MKLSDTYSQYIANHSYNYVVFIWCYYVLCSISQLLSIPSASHFRDLVVPSRMSAGDFCWMYIYTVNITWSRSEKNDELLWKKRATCYQSLSWNLSIATIFYFKQKQIIGLLTSYTHLQKENGNSLPFFLLQFMIFYINIHTHTHTMSIYTD